MTKSSVPRNALKLKPEAQFQQSEFRLEAIGSILARLQFTDNRVTPRLSQSSEGKR